MIASWKINYAPKSQKNQDVKAVKYMIVENNGVLIYGQSEGVGKGPQGLMAEDLH